MFDTLEVPADAEAYLCGPADFLSDLATALAAAGVATARIHTEIFGARPALTPA